MRHVTSCYIHTNTFLTVQYWAYHINLYSTLSIT